ncbi:hypothetical protein QBC32DRAFT_312515 [Pseudoneurospora amorphoporcata]|uniref:Uncharacterized protein n=1 Tax=Pseudoneurospora amorphoporcata TaxID=241081 RepID=A0AAN6P173_9PEZI|nr:hypothetical protein QBC32DRAFT_312515 [Pseudoneurospora amorphoporcata]
MCRPPHGHGHGNPNHPGHPSYHVNPNSNPSTPPGTSGMPSPSFSSMSAPNTNTNQSKIQQQQQQQPSDRNATAHAASTLLSTFTPYACTTSRIASLKTELQRLESRQRIFRRLAHAAVLFSSDHELRYSLLDKCNDLAECMKAHPRLRQEVGKMNEVELQLFSISSTAKQLVQDVEWVRAEDVRDTKDMERKEVHTSQGAQEDKEGSRGQGQGQGKKAQDKHEDSLGKNNMKKAR